MHELGIALDVIETVTARAQGARVKRVVIDVGVLTAVLPDALSFCFGLASEGTAAEGASFEVRSRSGRARCRACTSELELLRPFGRCACGGTELDWLSGDELTIFEMEVE
ncbi:MAG TPA: hydrogenase maturation nickel metallochaperone HypA [Polyangiaceae bacterium]|jgi:hydrogenase nickel incorporation protein HypA/HybF|nr:hydrogenase maturation nickel metallochaperone HypA [Polyangiaceae bacterium]